MWASVNNPSVRWVDLPGPVTSTHSGLCYRFANAAACSWSIRR